MEKPITPKRHLPSTIVIGVLLIVAILIAILAYSVNYGATIKEMADSAKGNTDSAVGQATGAVVVGVFGGSMLILFFFLAAVIIAGISIFGLIKSIFNFRTSMGAIKIINIIYMAVTGSLLLLTVFRIVLFAVTTI